MGKRTEGGGKTTAPPFIVLRAGEDTSSLTLTFGDLEMYKEALVEHLRLPERGSVVAVNPLALEEAEHTAVELIVETTSGTYAASVDLIAELPVAVSSGIRNIARGVPSMVQAPPSASGYAWTMTRPMASAAALDSASSRWPLFVPDQVGLYMLNEGSTGTSLQIYAGDWSGGITGLDGPGHHWTASGCAACHTLGYDPAADNAGFDDAATEEGWVVPAGKAGNYLAMLSSAPDAASLANIQCESCHGPNASDAHMHGMGPRTSVASAACGSCRPRDHPRDLELPLAARGQQRRRAQPVVRVRRDRGEHRSALTRGSW
jgi:hypothetical protein